MRWLNGREAAPLILCLIAFAVGATTSKFFLDWNYLLGQTTLYIETGFLAIGMTFVILSGEIDLSVASTLALTACSSAVLELKGLQHPLACAFGIALGTALGLINGLLVSRIKIPSFMVTLGTMAVYRGAAQVLVGPSSVKVIGADSAQHLYLWQFGLVLIISGLALHRTVFGRWIFAVGTNERAAFYSGVPTRRVVTVAFAISGCLAGIAGIIMNQRLGVARFDDGLGLELDAITAVVLGGASIFGGIGTIVGTLVALVLLGLVRTAMGIANVTTEFQLAIIGSMLVISVLAGNGVEKLMNSFRRRDKPA